MRVLNPNFVNNAGRYCREKTLMGNYNVHDTNIPRTRISSQKMHKLYLNICRAIQENFSVNLLNITDADELTPTTDRDKASMHDRVLSIIMYYNWNTLWTQHLWSSRCLLRLINTCAQLHVGSTLTIRIKVYHQ